jgi:hypothetical protein
MAPERAPPDDPSPVDIGKSQVLTGASVSFGTRTSAEAEPLGDRWSGRAHVPRMCPSGAESGGTRWDRVGRDGMTNPSKIKGMVGNGASCLGFSILPCRVRIPPWALRKSLRVHVTRGVFSFLGVNSCLCGLAPIRGRLKVVNVARVRGCWKPGLVLKWVNRTAQVGMRGLDPPSWIYGGARCPNPLLPPRPAS